MTPEMVVELGRQALWITVLISAPLLLAALVVGLLIGMFQAATQINESTLSFIPKLAVLALALALGGGWMLRMLIDFTHNLITNIPNVIG